MPTAFLDTETVWTDASGQPWAHLLCIAAAGELARSDPDMYRPAESAPEALPDDICAPVVSAREDALRFLQEDTPEGYDALMRRLYPLLGSFPEPRLKWHAYGYVTAHIGEGYWRWSLLTEEPTRRQELLERAEVAFSDAVRSPGGFPNLWVHLRRGQIAYALGNDRAALDELTRAYMGGGRAVFAHEDPKYMALLDAALTPPQGEDRLP